jgi:hypothetical protein
LQAKTLIPQRSASLITAFLPGTLAATDAFGHLPSQRKEHTFDLLAGPKGIDAATPLAF